MREAMGWAVMLSCPAVGSAQSPAFDAASIKPAASGLRGYSIRPVADWLAAQNATLKLLIGEAYHVYDFQVSGPKWIDADRFDIEATAGGGAIPNRKEMREMLQKLLADRFALVVRKEEKEMPVYTLEPAKGGPKVAPTKHADAPEMFRVFQRRQVTAENAPLEALIEVLTWLLGKPVLDRTGMEGNFDYKLEWAPDEVQVQSQEAPPQTDGQAPSLTGALQQQMGLRLVAKRAPVELIVVEWAEKPASN